MPNLKMLNSTKYLYKLYFVKGSIANVLQTSVIPNRFIEQRIWLKTSFACVGLTKNLSSISLTLHGILIVFSFLLHYKTNSETILIQILIHASHNEKRQKKRCSFAFPKK